MFPREALSRPYRELTTREDVEALMRPHAGAVVLDFWSGSSAPCRAMAAQFEAVAHDYAGLGVAFCRVETDAHPELAQPFQIRSLPTLVFVSDGVILEAAVGRIEAQRLARRVDWLITNTNQPGLLSRLFGRRRASH
jgi:thioredoxin 1